MSRFKSRINALADALVKRQQQQEVFRAASCAIVFDYSSPEEIARARAATSRARIPLIHIHFVAPPDQYRMEMYEPTGSACRWESPTSEAPGDEMDQAIQEVVDVAYKTKESAYRYPGGIGGNEDTGGPCK